MDITTLTSLASEMSSESSLTVSELRSITAQYKYGYCTSSPHSTLLEKE